MKIYQRHITTVFAIALLFILLQEIYAQDIINFSKAELDSVQHIEKSYKMILKERCNLYQYSQHYGEVKRKGRLMVGEVVEVLKEYKDYVFVKTPQNGYDKFGWINRECIKKRLNTDRKFYLKLTLGDSLGRGVLTNPVRISSDSAGNFYILENSGSLKYRLHKYNPNGEFAKFIPLNLEPLREIPGPRRTAFMKAATNGDIFILTDKGITKLSQDGEIILEINKASKSPIALDISEDEQIYMLETKKGHAWIKIFSKEGHFVDSLQVEDLQRPIDIKVRNKKIYILGERIRPFEHIFLKGDREKISEYRLKLIEEGLKESKHVIRIYSLDNLLIREITVKDMFPGIEDVLQYEPEFWKYGFYDFRIKLGNMTVDDFGNIFVFIYVRGEDCGASFIGKYDSLGHYKKKLPYSYEGCIYGGSSRSTIPWRGGTDIETYKDNSILFIEKEVYRVKDDFLSVAIMLAPNEESFINPTAIAIDNENNVLVSDTKLNVLKKFDSRGHLLWSTGGSGEEKGRFKGIGDIALDRLGYIYVADNANRRVQKFDENGNFISLFDTPRVGISEAGTLFDIYVKQDLIHVYQVLETQVFTLDGQFVEGQKNQFFREDNRLYRPIIAFDKYQRVWSIDRVRYRELSPIKIYMCNKDGEILDVYTAENFDVPPEIISDLAFDEEGNLWIADPGTYQVKKYAIK